MSNKKIASYIKSLYDIIEKGNYNPIEAEEVLIKLTLEYTKGNVIKTSELLDVAQDKIKNSKAKIEK